MIFSTKPSRRETIWGGIYLGLYILVLPWLVSVLAQLFGRNLDGAQINFIYFCVNFAATTVIFRTYLLQSLIDALARPLPTFWYALLGYLGSLMLGGMVTSFCLRLYPDFSNVNDAAVGNLVSRNFPLMFIGTVLLAPVTEELLFRGLIFRGIWDRSPLLAHVVSIVFFSLIHISGYIGLYEPRLLLLCFLQYLPAAYCLNFAYRYGGSIVSPMLMHMLTNLIVLSAMR